MDSHGGKHFEIVLKKKVLRSLKLDHELEERTVGSTISLTMTICNAAEKVLIITQRVLNEP